MHDSRTDAEPGSTKSRSSALECLQHCSDRSIYSEELYRITCVRSDCEPISPLRANIGRTLNLESVSRVLLLNWGDSALPFFLGSNNIDVEVDPAGEEVASLVALQCASLGRVKTVRNEAVHSYSGTYDLIIARSSVHRDPAAFLDLINGLMPFVGDAGYLALALEGASGPGQYEQLIQTIEDSQEAVLHPEETLLALPSLNSPEMLTRTDFLGTTPGAWVHIAPYLDENGLPRLPGTAPKRAVWRILQQHDTLPLSSVDRFLVLSHPGSRQTVFSTVDFLHTSFGTRKRQFWLETTKPRSLASVCRKQIYPEASGDRSATTGHHVPEFQHKVMDEQYLPYPKLSELWLEALQNTRSGMGSFRDLVEVYVTFLQQTLGEMGAKPLDLIPDNVVVDPAGGYHAVDQEWWTARMDFGAPEALYRGLVYFLSRHVQSLRSIALVREVGESYGDFLETVFHWAGQDLSAARDAAELIEGRFRDFSLDQYAVVEFSALERSRFDDNVQVSLACSCDLGPQSVVLESEVTALGSVARRATRFCFLFPVSEQKPKTLLIRPDCGQGPFSVNAVTAVLEDGDQVHQLMDLRGSAEIKSKCSLQSCESDPKESGLFFPTRPDASVVVDLPEETREIYKLAHLKIIIEVSWPDAGYQRLFERRNLDRLWRQEQTLMSLAGSLERTEEQLRSTREELALLKSSKAWRVAERFRSIVYGSLLGRNRQVTETASGQALTGQNSPTSRIDDLLTSFPGIPGFRHDFCSSGPKFSIVLPVHDTPGVWLSDAVGSVCNQSYANWELIVVNDGSRVTETRAVLDKLDHPQINVFSLDVSVGISAATCHGIDAATGDFVAFIDHDDMLTPDALHELVGEIDRSAPDILYTDESLFDDSTTISEEGYFGEAHFKPDYSPDLLLAHNYITHLLVVRKTLLDRVGGPRIEFDGAQDYDLLLRLTEKTDRIAHLPKVLYCWRRSPQSTSLDAGVKPEAHERGRRAVCQALVRRGEEGTVLNANALHFFRVKRSIRGCPKVSIVVPFRDQPILLDKCIDSIVTRTGYENFEIVGVDNGSEDELTHELMMRLSAGTEKIRFHSFDKPFNFPAIVNFGVEKARGEHVVLLNNDIQVINSDWLEAMLEHSQRPEIGAVGAKLYFPDDTIQHAGIIVGIAGYAGHSHKHKAGADGGYLNRLNVVQNVSAVTGAMLMCSKQVYQSVGGFDAKEFGVACNDVDFCLRLMEAGFRNIFTPYARAYHVESASRGYEDTPEKKNRFNNELARFRTRHQEILASGDPYYNRNLSRESEVVTFRPIPAPETVSQTTT